ncbi:glycosyltransferase [Roseomonas terrae]|uniref:Glycosyltransferase n=1 Tax=Neoroseomonas terrae TaxID=424799 RepID=A0ABS5EG80_9PROT|nr:glycosyltransferase family 2 protein [Neoroseomonas terrae]MBR0649985.1 glycosyltransferase [Neoroseomonas terrae]
MASFNSLTEIRRHGERLVRLYRVALGRDPNRTELQSGVERLQAGEVLRSLAADVISTAESTQRAEPSAAPKNISLEVSLSNAGLDGDQRIAAMRLLQAAIDFGADEAEAIAMLADSPPLRASLPLLPGLAPGSPPDDDTAYHLWVATYDTPAPAGIAPPPSQTGPGVIIVMTASDTSIESALRSVESLSGQSYPHWQLHLAARTLSPWAAQALAAAAAAEPRLVLKAPSPDGQPWPPPAADEALICFLEPGDTLAPSALQEVVATFQSSPELELVYSDEDVGRGIHRRAPRFKPDLSADLLLVGNAIGQLAMYRASLLRRVRRPVAAPFAAYDLALQAVALIGVDRVGHIPAVLCHRSAPPTDWPAPATTPPRQAPGLVSIEPGEWPRLRFRLPEPPPLVSTLILTRDRPELLAACIRGLLEATDYPSLELIIVDNGSTDPQALTLLDRLAATARASVLRRHEPFNFAAMNNVAAARATGEVLLLLNNDVEPLHPDWLREMVSHAMRPDVGAVGAKLLYPDGRLQHAGLLLGPNGSATHVGRHARSDDPGYDGQLACTRDLSAVTGACLAMRRSVFEQIGGMQEKLAVAWNDVDLCLRVRAAGLRVVWTPHATLTHRELSTRGDEALDATKLARFRAEQSLMRELWGRALDEDPFLNPNLLATEAGPLVLTRPRRARPWEA